MGYKINGTTISLTRGDSFYATISIKNQDGSVYVPEQGDTVRFALKSQKTRLGDFADIEPLILKAIPADTLLLHLEPDDTKTLPFGEYAYDIELTHVNGDVDTFIQDSTLYLMREVH